MRISFSDYNTSVDKPIYSNIRDLYGNYIDVYSEEKQMYKLLTITKNERILTILSDEEVILRSNGNERDSLDLITGILIKRIDDDGNILQTPERKQLNLVFADESNNEVKELRYYDNSIITINSNSIMADLEYRIKTKNYYELKELSTNSDYTLRFKGTINSMTIGGNTITSIENNSIINLSSITGKNLTVDGCYDELMIIKGNVIDEPLCYVRDEMVIKGMTINVSDGTSDIVFGKGGRL